MMYLDIHMYNSKENTPTKQTTAYITQSWNTNLFFPPFFSVFEPFFLGVEILPSFLCYVFWVFFPAGIST